MTLLEEIQSAAVDQNSDLGTILRKCKLLAARLGSQPLENWLIYESNGYPENIEVPDYRIWSLTVKGHFFGPYGSGLKNAPIPSMCIPKSIRDDYLKYKCRQSIASLEAMLKKSEDSQLQIPTADLAVVLGTSVYEGQNCVQAWAEIGVGAIIEILNTVRNRILDFALAVWKDNPKAGELLKNPEHLSKPEKITQIFNTTVHGGTANLVGSAIDSPIAFNIINNDFSSLENVLKKNGINTEDIEDLKIAVDSDPKPESENQLGPKVSQWIAKMMQKAADGSWKIGIGAAGSFLAQAIAKYYGL